MSRRFSFFLVVVAAIALSAALAMANVAAKAQASAPSALPAQAKLTTAPQLTGTSTPTPGCVGTWSIVASPSITDTHTNIYDINGSSANDIWAVGGYGYTSRTFTMHWNGSEWTIIPSPNVTTTLSNILSGVVAFSGQDAWAVGYVT